MEIKHHAIERGISQKKIKNEMEKHRETNENDNATCHNLEGAAKAVLKGKFIALQA